MSFLKVWIHGVFSTKNREPLLEDHFRLQVFKHMKKDCAEKKIHLDFINGYCDHVHCLISLNGTQAIADVMHQIKGESSRWINTSKFIEQHFNWQDKYFAVSVNPKELDVVRAYIKNQHIKHKKQSFDDELKELVNQYGFAEGNWMKEI